MNKYILLLTLLSFVLHSFSIDTLNIQSKIKEVTVFFDGAQVSRVTKANLNTGKYLLKIEKLPAELEPNSIQLTSSEKAKVLSVKHDLIYPKQKSKVKTDFDLMLKAKEIEIKSLRNKIKVFEIEERILLDNSKFGSAKNGASIEEIKQASEFYRFKLNEINKEKLQLSVDISNVNDEIKDLRFELNKKLAEDNKVYSQISFVIESKTAMSTDLKLSYFITSAGWTPLYDFRVRDIKQAMNIVYNAHIFQSSGEDWENVKLKLSTNKPSLSHAKPELETWFINRGRSQRLSPIKEGSSTLKGAVYDNSTGEPIPFANVSVLKGKNVITGAMTDFDGRFTIKPIKSGYYDLEASYLGYQTTEISNVPFRDQRITFQDFKLTESISKLKEVVVMDYKVPLISKDQLESGGTITSEDLHNMPMRSVAANVSGVSIKRNEVQFIEGYHSNKNMSSLEYKISIPYSIPSDGKDYNVKIKEIALPVDYVYYAVPKMEKEAFLVAEIPDWSSLELLSGDASVYYQGTYTGQSLIDVNSIKDTLGLSLSRDHNIVVERSLLKDKNEKQFVGKNTKQTINWNISIRNNKAENVKLILEDQLPISENSDIVIKELELSGSKIDRKTGKIRWELKLAPNEKKEVLLKYSVKYPSYLKLQID